MDKTLAELTSDIERFDEILAQNSLDRGENLIANSFLLALELGGQINDTYFHVYATLPNSLEYPPIEQVRELHTMMSDTIRERGISMDRAAERGL